MGQYQCIDIGLARIRRTSKKKLRNGGIKPFLFCLEFRAFFFFILEFPVIFSLKYTEILLHLSSQLFTAVPAPMRALFGPFPCNGAMTSDPVGRLCARARAYVSSLDVLIVTVSTSQSSPLLPT